MKWGFIGYGRIARKFEESLRHTDEQIIAIASRSGAANVLPPIRAYRQYDDLLQDKEVEIVYVNTTHNTHCQHTVAALNAGKHVLCEKPMGISSDEVRQMIDAARKNKRFLMEGVWTRYLPAYKKVKQLVSAGAIGEVIHVNAQFGFRMNPEAPKERLIKPELAAGAIWDVGIYPISFAQDFIGEFPIKFQVNGVLSPLGVEDRCAIQLGYSHGRMAQLSCAIDISLPNLGLLSGNRGEIVMKDFWRCESFTVQNEDGFKEYHLPMISNGLQYEALACTHLIHSGKLESPVMKWEDSLQLAQIMDKSIQLARS